MAYPERYHLDALRKLRGDASVTYPTADLSTPTVERVYSVPREKTASPDAFNAPQTIEYTGTQLTEQHFTGGDANYVEVYQKWETLPGTSLVTKTIGTPESLIPEKYRRLITTTDTNQPVAPDYDFPDGLVGTQKFISLAQETISRLRLRIITEVINEDEDPLTGQQTDEWGILTVQESIVADGSPADEGYLVKHSEVTPLGNGLSIKITVNYSDDLGAKVHYGQDWNRQFNIPLPYIEEIIEAGDGDIGSEHSEITPIDDWRSKIKTTDVSALETALGTYLRKYFSVADIPLPDVLTSVQSVKNESFGEGNGSASGSSSATGTHGAISLSIPSSNQSSAALSYELVFNITSGRERGRNKRVMRGVFFMLSPYEPEDLIDKLTDLLGADVNFWPDFRPQHESFVVQGMNVAIQTTAQTQTHLSYDADSESEGAVEETSQSFKTGLDSKPIRISETIHGALMVGGDGAAATRTVVSTSESTQSGSVGATAGPIAESATATSKVTPATLSATPGVSAYPTEGFYLLGLDTEPFEYLWDMIHFEIFDFSVLA